MEEKRLTKDEYYLSIAEAVSKRSTCLRRRFGAIVVVNDAIVATGYNGPARGSINCHEVGCLKDLVNAPHYGRYDLCPAVHAEENAIINAARHGISVLGGTLYIVGKTPSGEITESIPCDRCKRVLINAGIKRVITKDEKGNIIIYEVEKWKRYDREEYIKKINEVKNRDKSKENQN